MTPERKNETMIKMKEYNNGCGSYSNICYLG